MAPWRHFPFDAAAYVYSPTGLKKHWARLHAGDAEPWPADERVRAAWALFHAGDFREAVSAGLAAGGAGITVANKAQAVHANYLERSETAKLARFLEVVQRAEAQARTEPDNANAHFWRAYALGRYSQTINVVKALALGLGTKIRASLETVIALAPAHADAHIALGTYHAELIDKLGKLQARALGADGATALRLFERALKLNPDSVIARTDGAVALVMIDGHKRANEANELFTAAAACQAMDATERLEVEVARAGLHD